MLRLAALQRCDNSARATASLCSPLDVLAVGRHAAYLPQTFLYQFDHEVELIKLAQPHDGVCHSSEIPFVFHYDPLLLGSGEVQLSDQIVSAWTSFATRGDPNSPSTGGSVAPGVSWPRYNDTARGFLKLVRALALSCHWLPLSLSPRTPSPCCVKPPDL